jgi:hypothetical protein
VKDRRVTPSTYQLTDRDGESHSYVTIPHPTSEANPLYLQLGSAFAPVITQLMAEQAKGVSASAADSPAVLTAAASGMTQLSPATIQALFKYTSRDGAELRNKDNYDVAFCGNAWEQVLALGEIIKANGFLPF